jgi:hypothetical protein
MATTESPWGELPPHDIVRKWLHRVDYAILAAVAISLVVRGLFAWAIAYRTNSWEELADLTMSMVSLHVLAVPAGLIYLVVRFLIKDSSVRATVAVCALLLSLPGLALVSEAGASIGRNMLSSELNVQQLAQECLQIALAPRKDQFVPEEKIVQHPMLSRLRPRSVLVTANEQVDVFLHWGRGESAWGYSLHRVDSGPNWELTELHGGRDVLATAQTKNGHESR